jgi:hypothetical protein
VGDDNGPGRLIYPQRSDFQTGDLDLTQMQISRDKDGFRFEAKFKNPIRNPRSVTNTVGNDSLADFARKGFYQVNLDIYVDTDRVKGSGNTSTLPGRQVRIDSSYAWEKAVILTPRPELMRGQLLDALMEQYPERTSAENEASVDKQIVFPTRIIVRKRSIVFFVPASFFDGSDGTDWGVTAFVTGAIINIPANFSLVSTAKKPLEELQLGVMQPVPGHSQDTFGYSGIKPSPVVDFLGEGEEQQQMLAKNELVGVAWGPHAAGSAALPDLSVTGSNPATVGSTTAAAPVVTVDKLFQPESSSANPQASSPAATSSLVDQSIVKRLQTLQQLFDQKLIDETEYKQQKQRILKEL